jgi:diguanylate cyclase (GGDEF)-like protein
LTGLANRRSILELLDKAVAFATTHGQALSVALFDVDRFKAVNDNLGHLVGDAVLQEVADSAHRALGQDGTLGRYGGEEFLVILPGADLNQARSFADEIRVAVLKGTEAAGHPVTITAGVARLRAGEDMDALLSTADQALYRGKEAGRNQVVVAEA